MRFGDPRRAAAGRERGTPVGLRQTLQGALVLALFAVPLGAGAGWCWRQIQLEQRLATAAVTTTATITATDRSRAVVFGLRPITYVFVHEGHRYVGEAYVGEDRFEALTAGGTIRVRLLSRNPGISLPEWRSAAPTLTKTMWVLGSLSALFAVGMVAMVVRLARGSSAVQAPAPPTRQPMALDSGAHGDRSRRDVAGGLQAPPRQVPLRLLAAVILDPMGANVPVLICVVLALLVYAEARDWRLDRRALHATGVVTAVDTDCARRSDDRCEIRFSFATAAGVRAGQSYARALSPHWAEGRQVTIEYTHRDSEARVLGTRCSRHAGMGPYVLLFAAIVTPFVAGSPRRTWRHLRLLRAGVAAACASLDAEGTGVFVGETDLPFFHREAKRKYRLTYDFVDRAGLTRHGKDTMYSLASPERDGPDLVLYDGARPDDSFPVVALGLGGRLRVDSAGAWRLDGHGMSALWCAGTYGGAVLCLIWAASRFLS